MWVGFAGFVDEFGCAYTPFLGSVAVSSHESEHEVEEVVCWFW
jgi:hypothetical protein